MILALSCEHHFTVPRRVYASRRVLFRVPNTPRALYANAETNNQAIKTKILPTPTNRMSLYLSGNLQEGVDSRIDPADNDEPLDNVTSLETLFHGPAVGSVRQRRGGCRADEEEDLCCERRVSTGVEGLGV